MSALVAVQAKMYKQLCLTAKQQSDDDSAFLATHRRAASANRTNYIIKCECLARLESLQPDAESAPVATPAADGDDGSKPNKGIGTELLKALVKSTPDKPTADKQADEPLTLAQAIRKLDPSNDEHWTNAGLPAMDAVESFFGKNVKRGDVENVAAGYDREAARETAE